MLLASLTSAYSPCFYCRFILRFSIRLDGMKASHLVKDSSKGGKVILAGPVMESGKLSPIATH